MPVRPKRREWWLVGGVALVLLGLGIWRALAVNGLDFVDVWGNNDLRLRAAPVVPLVAPTALATKRWSASITLSGSDTGGMRDWYLPRSDGGLLFLTSSGNTYYFNGQGRN